MDSSPFQPRQQEVYDQQWTSFSWYDVDDKNYETHLQLSSYEKQEIRNKS